MMPSSPMLGRRSGTNSPKMDRLDFVKDSVIGELSSRIGKPIPEFNKNKRGSSGDCELAIVLSPPSATVSRNVPDYAKETDQEDPDLRPRAITAARPHLQPQSASAPCSPRLGLRRPQQQITITSSATLKVTNNSRAGTPTSRDRSKSPAVNRLTAPSNSRSTSSNPSASRRSRPSPSPTRRSRPTTQTTIPVGGHTSVKMSTKRKSPGRTVPPNLNRSISADPRNGKTGYNRSVSAENSDPRLNDPAIQAKIGNRQTKTVEKTIGKCGMCMKPVTVEGCTAFGKVYHKECFKCCVCKRRIDGKFFQKNGKPYCEKDYAKIVEECCVCKQPIKGDCIESGTKAYHPGCLKCFVCQEILRGQYFFYEGEPICEQDYKRRAEKCSECGEPIIGTCYTFDGKNFCEEHYMAKCDNCPKCGEQVTGHMVRTNAAAFHSKCFTCVACNKDLSHDQFILDDQKNIYCTDDWAKKKAYRCTTCKRPIVPAEGQTNAPRLRALGKDYHPDCFKCEDCGLLLDTRKKGRECYPHKNHIFCLKCNRKKFSSDEESSDNEDN
jgi:hypothetical protein